MKAGVLVSPGNIQIKELPLPEPSEGELRVRLTQTGICGSDVHLFLGHRKLSKPTVIGHEGLGFIDKKGPKTTLELGQRVVIEPNIPCGHCRLCRDGRGDICPAKRVLGNTEDGCFAEYICLPEAFCHAVPSEITDEDAVLTEPTAVALHALKLAGLRAGEPIAIIGLGAIGLLINHLAISMGYRTYVSEPNPAKVARAIAEGALAGSGDSNALRRQWEDAGVVAVFESAGAAQTVNLALESAPRGAKVILLGLSTDPASFVPLDLVRSGISILSSIIYDHPFDFAETLRLMAEGTIHPGKFISSVDSLTDLQEALERAAAGNETKVIVNCHHI